MNALAEMILEQSASQPEGSVLTAKGFLHLGSRAAVDQALSRLARAGRLLRITRGQYVRPLSSRFGEYPPAPERVVEGVAAVTGETIAPSGAVAANRLGLSSQLPIRPVFLTSGRTRRIRLGKQIVELRHAPAWQLREPHSPSGQVVRALAWLGREHAQGAAAHLKTRLPASEIEAVAASRAVLPTWLAEVVSREFVPGPSHAH
jgi:hypothetical protein